jgi:sulfite reductase (NADPH) flavoprotein alpha-component
MQSTPQTNETEMEVTKAEMEQMSPAATNGHSYKIREQALDLRSSAPDSSDSVLLLYATVTGTAESLALQIAAALRATGQHVKVRDMAHCQPQALTRTNCVLMVVSTYGDGEPPDDAVPFWEAVVRGNGLNLRGVKFSVLALGNTTYDQFCQCGRDFDAALERHGATRIFPRVDCDVDYDAPAAYWLRGVIAQLIENNRSLLSA